MLPECAEALRPLWEAASTPDHFLFRARHNGEHDGYAVPQDETVRADLARAKIPLQDERGRWADFHSFRYTFCTWMAQHYPIQEVQKLMRHSTIKLTADLYNDLGLKDTRANDGVLRPLNLPAAKKPEKEPAQGTEQILPFSASAGASAPLESEKDSRPIRRKSL
jgi:integrase